MKKDDRAGIGIGVITRGTVSVKWMSHMDYLRKYMPVGVFWKYIFVEGKSYAEGRIEVVKRAQKENMEYLVFVDDDVFLPNDAIIRMLGSGKDIISGIYWTKSDIPMPVIFEKMGSGPFFNFPVDKVFEIAGSGLGACLINMKVFDKFDEENIPYFKENWTGIMDSGHHITAPIGEDHYFFYEARKLGFKVWCDSGILCDHYDINNKIFYPGEKIVRDITGQKLIEDGEEELVSNIQSKLGLDKDKKTVVFFNSNGPSFTGDTLLHRGLGGAETTVINLARKFSERGFNSHVLCNCEQEGIFDGVGYHSIQKYKQLLPYLSPDLLVVVRDTRMLVEIPFKDLGAKKVVLWCQDTASTPVFKHLEEGYDKVDTIVALSDWHKNNIIELYPFVSEDKVVVLRNGVDYSRFVGKDIVRVSNKLIYTSTPFRGAELLPRIISKVRESVPDAHIDVYSSMKVYDVNYNETHFLPLYHTLKNTAGINYKGTVDQYTLADAIRSSRVMVYPNTFDETSCISVMEAQVAGTPVVTSRRAALAESVLEGAGVLVDGNPRSSEYVNEFANAVVKYLTNEDFWVSSSDAGFAGDFSWGDRCEDWVREFFEDKLIG